MNWTFTTKLRIFLSHILQILQPSLKHHSPLFRKLGNVDINFLWLQHLRSQLCRATPEFSYSNNHHTSVHDSSKNCTSSFFQLLSFAHSLYYLSTSHLTFICWISNGFRILNIHIPSPLLAHAHLFFTFILIRRKLQLTT